LLIMKNLQTRLLSFSKERDWEQFHSPKNLVMALSAEVGELTEIFQWLTEEQSAALPKDKLEKVKEEIGDIQIYLARLADRLGIDPIEAAHSKIEKNKKKYPISKAKGIAKKYTEFRK